MQNIDNIQARPGATRILFMLGLLAASISPPQRIEAQEATTQKPLKLYTLLYPLEEFAQTIGGQAVEVINLTPPNEDPATWIPSRKQILEMQNADLIIINGAHFEKCLEKVFLPTSRIVDTCRFLRGNEIILPEQPMHKHANGVQHKHSGIDGHTWVDPLTAQQQCVEILKALCRKRPLDSATFTSNFETLSKQFQDLDTRIKEVVKGQQNKTLLASHPAYNYLARRYKLKIITHHLDPKANFEQAEFLKSKEPSSDALRVMLWEAEPTKELSSQMREQLGIASELFSPIETRTEQEKSQGKTYFSTMKANIKALDAAYKITPTDQGQSSVPSKVKSEKQSIKN